MYPLVNFRFSLCIKTKTVPFFTAPFSSKISPILLVDDPFGISTSISFIPLSTGPNADEIYA